MHHDIISPLRYGDCSIELKSWLLAGIVTFRVPMLSQVVLSFPIFCNESEALKKVILLHLGIS